MNKPELIVMLTLNDRTIKNAFDYFNQCRSSCVRYIGIKEEGIPHAEMKRLCAGIRECGKTAVLEVVAYTEEKCLEGAQLAVECGCDILMGTLYSDSVNDLCKLHGLKYMPFIGQISDRPSVLNGSIDEMISEAKEYLSKGVYGFDLLGYRYTGDAVELNRRFVSEVNAPVCIAGSVNSYKRLDEIKMISPWAFTIGSAFFENVFDNDFNRQIYKVLDYMNK